MSYRERVLLCFLLSLLVNFASAQTTVASRNDHIFPAAATAKPYINYDAYGFLINGKRVFITSAGMEYARVPRALWHDRLLRLKRAGFNAIELYTFWNFHEPKEGQFNFAGDHDLNAYLKIIKAMGMYAIVRVGPYYCGEWSMGGFPIWLKFKPGLRVREDNPQFLKAVDHFFDRLIPIVAANQINNGGAVIMVQLENEHRAGWGTVTPNNYFRHLISKTVGLGLKVPYFFSGLHPGNDPAGDMTNLDDNTRPNPWFSTEYWGVWFLNYGPQDQDSTLYDRRTWKIIAHGGNGYNVYMAHGGTNFDYNNDRDNAASYDYGASVGQAGDLRPIYYSFKRANWFARSFQNILANSIDATAHKPTVSDTAVKVTMRKSPAGNIAFLDNTDSVAVKFKLTPPINTPIKTSTAIKLAPGEIMPVVQNYPLTPHIRLLWAPTRIYGIIPQGKTTTLLIYGDVGSAAQLYFDVPEGVKITNGQAAFKMANGILSFTAATTASPLAYSFEIGGQTIRIIAVSNVLASHTWFAENNGQITIITSPDYVDNVTDKTILTERPWLSNNNSPVWVFRTGAKVVKLKPPFKSIAHLTKLKLDNWQAQNASAPALPGYNDKAWKQSKYPLQMGADGDITASAWYRTKITVAKTGNYMLRFTNVLDRAQLFLDGKRIDTGAIFSDTVNIYLTKHTTHTLTLFAAHSGRNKLIFKLGRIDTLDVKGLSGPVTLQKADGSGTPVNVINWRMRGGAGASPSEKGKYHQLNSPTFYSTTFSLPVLKNTRTIWRVNTTSLSYGSVWVNGHNLGQYPEKIKINGLYIPQCWLKAGQNKLLIYEENGTSPKKVSIEAEVAASRDTRILKI